MKVFKILVILAFVAAMPVAADKAFEPVGTTGVSVAPNPDAPRWERPRAILHDNGSFTTNFGTGVGGADESWTQTTLGMTTWGFGHQVASGYWIADQFTVPVGETWDITTITFFAYQSYAGNVSTMTAVHLRIWDGTPGVSTLVWGDTTTNVMGPTSWTNVYRVSDTDTGVNSDRAIMASMANVNTSLGEGTYFLDWQTDGSASSGPWAIPVVIIGNTTTGDALQSADGATYAAVVDNGSLTGQGFPFIVEGTLQGGGGGGGGGTGGTAEPVPALSNSGIVILVLAFIGIAAVLIRRRM